jgi:voltage-gated potassium channel
MLETDEKKTARDLRERIHEIIFGADTFFGVLFDVVLLIAIICSITVLCFETVPGIGCPNAEGDGSYQSELKFLSWFFTGLFTIEYGFRVYCVKRPWKYIWSFWGVVDLLAFLPDYLMLLPAFGSSNFHSRGFSVIRSLRLLRVFRIFRLGWFQFEADDLANAIWNARAKIVVFLAVVMIIVTVVGTLMYEIENAISDTSKFTSIPDGIYWAIVTMTTVGFGDIVPTTVAGKFLSAVLILIGYSLIIVPTGFVSAEIIDSRRKSNVSTRSCASCVSEGHDSDAIYCKYCGEIL